MPDVEYDDSAEPKLMRSNGYGVERERVREVEWVSKVEE